MAKEYAYRCKNGRLFYKLLSGVYVDAYNVKEINETEHPLPYEEDVLTFNSTREGAELILGKFRIEEATSPYMELPYIKMYEDFSSCKKISYNANTDELIIEDGISEKIFGFDILSSHDEWFDMVLEFVYYIVMHRNAFVYRLFTEFTAKTKRMQNHFLGHQKYNAIINIWNNIENLNNLEKIIKSCGEDFIIDNIGNKDFELKNAKKLHQVVEMPLVVVQTMKKLGIEEVFGEMKSIASVDKNHAVTLMDFICDYRKAFPGKEYCSKNDVLTFIRNISDLMALDIYKSNFNGLINFLVNENFNYSSFCLPTHEARELLDYWNIASGMINENKDIKFEKFPRNIQKAHNVIMQNSSIISNPRPEEFAAAVAKQSFLNDEKDEEYIFMVPRNEMDLLNEGNALQHCVASYRDRIIDNGTKVVLMRKKDDIETPFVTIEYDSGIAVQVKEMFNADVEDSKVLAAVNRWIARAERRELK